jgi:hypothetical protein
MNGRWPNSTCECGSPVRCLACSGGCRIFNFQKAYAVCGLPRLPASCVAYVWMQILDELVIAGELQESSKKSVIRVVCATRCTRCWHTQCTCRSLSPMRSRSRKTVLTWCLD